MESNQVSYKRGDNIVEYQSVMQSFGIACRLFNNLSQIIRDHQIMHFTICFLTTTTYCTNKDRDQTFAITGTFQNGRKNSSFILPSFYAWKKKNKKKKKQTNKQKTTSPLPSHKRNFKPGLQVRLHLKWKRYEAHAEKLLSHGHFVWM